VKVGDLVRVKDWGSSGGIYQRLIGHIGIVIRIESVHETYRWFDRVTIHIRGTRKNFRAEDLVVVNGSR